MSGQSGDDRFSGRARTALALARDEALRLNHNYIGTEHLLLGLLREGEGIAGRVLSSLGVELPEVRNKVELIIGRGARPVVGEIGTTPRAKKVIELAIDEARRLGHPGVGTEHLLLGLIREGEGIAAGVLESLGVSLKGARSEVLDILGAPRVAAPPRQPSDHSFDRFTERARNVLTLAHEEAVRFNHNYIGTEHLLLGLIWETESVAGRALSNRGITPMQIRAALEFILGRGERQVVGEVGLTPRAKMVIGLAIDEARGLGHHYIGTEHLLLGLIREGEGIAAGVLESLGVNMEKMRSEVVKVLAQPGESGRPDEGTESPARRAHEAEPTVWEYLDVHVAVENEDRTIVSIGGSGEGPSEVTNGMSVLHALSILGRNGWELAGIDPVVHSASGHARSLYIFKRRAQEQ